MGTRLLSPGGSETREQNPGRPFVRQEFLMGVGRGAPVLSPLRGSRLGLIACKEGVRLPLAS